MNNKKNIILVIAETRTTFDISFCFEEYQKSNLTCELSKQLWELRKNLGGDKLIFASASFIHRSDEWGYSQMKGAICDQTYIEGFKSDESYTNDDSSSMGLCFYEDGYVQLDKSQGFGNWKLGDIKKEGTVKDKTTEYIKELSKKYNIIYLVEINDGGYIEPIIDTNFIKEMGITPIKIEPTRPYEHYLRSDSVNIGEDIYVSSSKVSYVGAIDGLEKLNTKIKQQNKGLKKVR